MIRIAVAAALLAFPATAFAQSADDQAATGRPPQTIRSVTLTGNEVCPKGSATEVVVCSRNTEPYRIPKSLRDSGPIAAQNQSWVNKSLVVDQVSRVDAGLPDTCSPIGNGGQSGCALQLQQQYAAERRAQAASEQRVP